MSEKLSVEPAALRTAADVQDGIADDIKKPDDKAVADTKDAAGAAEGWSVGPALQEVADSWKKALDGLHERLTTGAWRLRETAKNHEWVDDWVQQDFEHFDPDAPVMASAPASGGPRPAAVAAGPARSDSPFG